MATNLSDIIKQNLEAKNKAKMTDETRASERLLGARFGVAAGLGSPGPSRSALGEAAAVSATQKGLDAAQDRGVIRSQQIRGTEAEMKQAEEQGVRSAGLSRQEFEQASKQQEQAIFNELERNKSQLGSQQGIAKLEELGFVLGLQDDKYVFDLEQQGEKQRLGNELEFKQSLQKAIYEDMYDLMEADTKFKEMIDADSREFQNELAKMDIEQALAVAATQASQANKQAMWQSVGTIGGIAAGYAGEKLSESDSTTSEDDTKE